MISVMTQRRNIEANSGSHLYLCAPIVTLPESLKTSVLETGRRAAMSRTSPMMSV